MMTAWARAYYPKGSMPGYILGSPPSSTSAHCGVEETHTVVKLEELQSSWIWESANQTNYCKSIK